MNREIARCLVVVLLVASVLVPVGCVSEDEFADDPISWSFAGGDGSWDANSRRWTVSLKPGEDKSVGIRLHNSSSERIVVNVVLWGPPDTISLRGGGRYPLPPGWNRVITLTAIAYQSATPGSHRYTVHCGNSFNMENIEP